MLLRIWKSFQIVARSHYWCVKPRSTNDAWLAYPSPPPSLMTVSKELTLNVRGPNYLGLTRSISWLLMHVELRGAIQYRISAQNSSINSNHANCWSSITSVSPVQSFWNCAQSMVVSLPCSLQYFRTIGPLGNKLWMNEISWYLRLRSVLDGYPLEECFCNFKGEIFTHMKDKILGHFQWNCPQVKASRSHWWLVSIGSGNGLVPSGNKPLSEPKWSPSSRIPYGITRSQLS